MSFWKSIIAVFYWQLSIIILNNGLKCSFWLYLSSKIILITCLLLRMWKRFFPRSFLKWIGTSFEPISCPRRRISGNYWSISRLTVWSIIFSPVFASFISISLKSSQDLKIAVTLLIICWICCCANYDFWSNARTYSTTVFGFRNFDCYTTLLTVTIGASFKIFGLCSFLSS